MQQRMRGAQRHQVQDASFDLFLTLPTTLDAPDASPQPEGDDEHPPQETTVPTTAAAGSPQPTAPMRATPNSSAKRRRLSDSGRAAPGGGGSEADSAPADKAALAPLHIPSGSPDRPAEEEIGESPVDAPGSGRRRSVAAIDRAAATSRSAALQQIISNTGSSRSSRSSRTNRALAKNAKDHAVASSSSPSLPAPAVSSPPASSPPTRRRRRGTTGLDELSPELSTMVDVSSTGGGRIGLVVPAGSTETDTQKTGTTTRTTRGGGIFSKLAAKSKQSGTNTADELSSPILNVVLESPDNIANSGMVASSSPLARKSTAGVRAAARATRASRLSGESQNSESTTPQGAAGKGKENAPEEEPDELSPEQQLQRPSPLSPATRRAGSRIQRASVVPSSSPISRPTKRMPLQPPTSSPRQQAVRSPRRTRGRPPIKPKAKEATADEVEEEAEEEDEQAEEIDALEAAKTIGRKRLRRGAVHEPSPELGGDPKQAEAGAEQPETADAEDNAERPAAKRRRRQNQEQSPAAQKQPRPPKASKAKPPTKRKRRRDDADDNDGEGSQGEEDLEGVGKAGRGDKEAPVPITVQRFSQVRRKSRGAGANDNDDDGDDNDELAVGGADLPFANRSGVNAVDVLAQICEDIVEQKLQSLHEKHQQLRQQQAEAGEHGDPSQTAAARKEAIVARRALESFQQELRSRLLEQAVAVDSLHALRKRVRAALKSKLALREEILRIRAERDQVALRMDALRAQHQDHVGKAMKTANISSTMHDIDLAVEQGRTAPELSTALQKTADLANLELAVRRITEQMSGGSGSLHGGGTLQQIVEFNAFLERTAAVLEGRKMPPRIAAA